MQRLPWRPPTTSPSPAGFPESQASRWRAALSSRARPWRSWIVALPLRARQNSGRRASAEAGGRARQGGDVCRARSAQWLFRSPGHSRNTDRRASSAGSDRARAAAGSSVKSLADARRWPLFQASVHANARFAGPIFRLPLQPRGLQVAAAGPSSHPAAKNYFLPGGERRLSLRIRPRRVHRGTVLPRSNLSKRPSTTARPGSSA